MIGTNAALVGASTLGVLLRIYLRRQKARRLAVDDYLIIAAQVNVVEAGISASALTSLAFLGPFGYNKHHRRPSRWLRRAFRITERCQSRKLFDGMY